MNQSIAVHNYQDQDRSALARMVTRIFVHWGLGSEDQLAMIGLSTCNRAALSRYRKGEPLRPAATCWSELATCWPFIRTCA